MWLWARRARDSDLLLCLRAGLLGGIWGTIGYDLVRVPFHLAGQNPFVPIRAYGVWITGAAASSPLTDVVGLAYHASNGITFGVMYMALVGDASRRSWWWAVAFATLLELAMLVTPYTTFFGIHPTTRFVIVTFAAHAIFGVALGLSAKWLADRWPVPVRAAA